MHSLISALAIKCVRQYCFLLTQRGQYDLADEILRHILVSNAYQSRVRQDSIRLALISKPTFPLHSPSFSPLSNSACALATDRFPAVVEHARKLITAYQFNNEPQRILLAALSSGLRPTDAFITSTLQKHLFREMKLGDTAVKTPELLKWNALNRRWAPSLGVKLEGAEEGEDGEDGGGGEAPSAAGMGEKDGPAAGTGAILEIPTKNNPIIIAIYGQICIAAKSYQSAICESCPNVHYARSLLIVLIVYLLHAYDYCPNDPMVCLCLAIASIGRAMQRQSDNRHHLIAQVGVF